MVIVTLPDGTSKELSDADVERFGGLDAVTSYVERMGGGLSSAPEPATPQQPGESLPGAQYADLPAGATAPLKRSKDTSPYEVQGPPLPSTGGVGRTEQALTNLSRHFEERNRGGSGPRGVAERTAAAAAGTLPDDRTTNADILRHAAGRGVAAGNGLLAGAPAQVFESVDDIVREARDVSPGGTAAAETGGQLLSSALTAGVGGAAANAFARGTFGGPVRAFVGGALGAAGDIGLDLATTANMNASRRGTGLTMADISEAAQQNYADFSSLPSGLMSLAALTGVGTSALAGALPHARVGGAVDPKNSLFRYNTGYNQTDIHPHLDALEMQDASDRLFRLANEGVDPQQLAAHNARAPEIAQLPETLGSSRPGILAATPNNMHRMTVGPDQGSPGGPVYAGLRQQRDDLLRGGYPSLEDATRIRQNADIVAHEMGTQALLPAEPRSPGQPRHAGPIPEVLDARGYPRLPEGMPLRTDQRGAPVYVQNSYRNAGLPVPPSLDEARRSRELDFRRQQWAPATPQQNALPGRSEGRPWSIPEEVRSAIQRKIDQEGVMALDDRERELVAALRDESRLRQIHAANAAAGDDAGLPRDSLGRDGMAFSLYDPLYASGVTQDVSRRLQQPHLPISTEQAFDAVAAERRVQEGRSQLPASQQQVRRNVDRVLGRGHETAAYNRTPEEAHLLRQELRQRADEGIATQRFQPTDSALRAVEAGRADLSNQIEAVAPGYQAVQADMRGNLNLNRLIRTRAYAGSGATGGPDYRVSWFGGAGPMPYATLKGDTLNAVRNAGAQGMHRAAQGLGVVGADHRLVNDEALRELMMAGRLPPAPDLDEQGRRRAPLENSAYDDIVNMDFGKDDEK